MSLRDEPSPRRVKLKRPQEVIGLFEILPNRVNLIDQILNTDNIVLLAQHPLNQPIIGQWYPLPIDLPIPPLIDQLPHRLPARIPIRDVWLDPPQHIHGGFVDPHEDSVVELSQAEKAQDADDLGVELVDTSDTDHEGEAGFGWDVQRTRLFGLGREVGVLFGGGWFVRAASFGGWLGGFGNA